jgi:Membrane proteins related to metalloendopeptidases
MKNIGKKLRKSILFIVITLLISGILPYSYIDYYISANTTGVSDSALKALEDQMAKIQQAKKENEAKLDSAEKDLLNEMQTKRLLDENVELTRQEIENQRNMLIELNNSIREKNENIKDLEVSIEDKYDIFLENMRASYEEGHINLLEVILSSGSLPEFIMNIEYAGSILDYQQSIMKELNAESELLTLKQTELNGQRELADQKEKELEAKESDLIKKADKSANYIDLHRKNITLTESDIEANNAALEKANQEFEAMIIKLEEQKALAKAQTYYTGTGELAWPTGGKNTSISSGYGERTMGKRTEIHKGLDIPVGFQDPIYASASGKVVQATYHSSYGYYVMIDHGLRKDGSSLYTLYAHNSSLIVKVGDSVEEGQQIAKGGSTGYSTGNHCHLEVRINGKAVNPRDYVSPP